MVKGSNVVIFFYNLFLAWKKYSELDSPVSISSERQVLLKRYSIV